MRLPRFKRCSPVAALQLTARDRQIIRQLRRHRFLRSWQIVALVGGSKQQILRRLHLLYHHGYLERPRCQLDYFHHGGSHHMIYGLGKKSSAVLKQAFGIDDFCIVEENRTIGRIYLHHALLVSDVMAAIELACRKDAHVGLLYEDELPIPEKICAQSRPFHWRVKVNENKLSVIPDRAFALEWKDGNNSNRIHFFLEADRGTMPVIRKTLLQTSFRRSHND